MNRLKRLTDLIQDLGIRVESDDAIAALDDGQPLLVVCGPPGSGIHGSTTERCHQCAAHITVAKSTHTLIEKREALGLPWRLLCMRCVTSLMKN